MKTVKTLKIVALLSVLWPAAFSGPSALAQTSPAPATPTTIGNLYGPNPTGLDPAADPNSLQSTYSPPAVQYDSNGQPIIQDTVVNQYSDQYKKGTRPLYFSKSPITPGNYSIFFVRTDTAKQDEAVLRLASRESVSGCAVIRQPTVEETQKGPTLWFNISDAQVGVDSSVRYAHFQCSAGRQYAGADLVLNRDRLLAGGITQVGLKSGAGTDLYSVEVDKSHIRLEPKSQRSFVPLYADNRPDPMIYWFYPADTIVLYAPVVPDKKDIGDKITELAEKAGLKKIETAIPEFLPPSQAANTLYFVDPGESKSKMLESGKAVPMGNVASTEKFYGVNGAYEQPVQVAVYARRPNAQD